MIVRTYGFNDIIPGLTTIDGNNCVIGRITITRGVIIQNGSVLGIVLHPNQERIFGCTCPMIGMACGFDRDGNVVILAKTQSLLNVRWFLGLNDIGGQIFWELRSAELMLTGMSVHANATSGLGNGIGIAP